VGSPPESQAVTRRPPPQGEAVPRTRGGCTATAILSSCRCEADLACPRPAGTGPGAGRSARRARTVARILSGRHCGLSEGAPWTPHFHGAAPVESRGPTEAPRCPGPGWSGEDNGAGNAAPPGKPGHERLKPAVAPRQRPPVRRLLAAESDDPPPLRSAPPAQPGAHLGAVPPAPLPVPAVSCVASRLCNAHANRFGWGIPCGGCA